MNELRIDFYDEEYSLFVQAFSDAIVGQSELFNRADLSQEELIEKFMEFSDELSDECEIHDVFDVNPDEMSSEDLFDLFIGLFEKIRTQCVSLIEIFGIMKLRNISELKGSAL